MASATSTDSEPLGDGGANGLPLHERIAIWGGLAALSALAWLYLARMAAAPAQGAMAGMAMPAAAHRWSFGDTTLTFLMWAVMMAAMMTPSAGPMVMTYARIARARRESARLSIAMFVAGYILAWTAFSAAAAIIQEGLAQAALISDSMRVAPFAGAAILAFAGLYQLTPLKRGCLGRCQSPMGFLMTSWREGRIGALRMGIRHGVWCVGCCWLLMAILFAVGVMNLAWVAALTAFVLIERVTRWGSVIATASGYALLASAVALVFFR